MLRQRSGYLDLRLRPLYQLLYCLDVAGERALTVFFGGCSGADASAPSSLPEIAGVLGSA
ncbi:MAG: hypothetical protein H7Z74_07655 [Anaerolineae bacterium]|nr:hypothetical protein [Gemmatimonadaceae bacterium]